MVACNSVYLRHTESVKDELTDTAFRIWTKDLKMCYLSSVGY